MPNLVEFASRKEMDERKPDLWEIKSAKDDE
jgi:hypothetical protein